MVICGHHPCPLGVTSESQMGQQPADTCCVLLRVDRTVSCRGPSQETRPPNPPGLLRGPSGIEHGLFLTGLPQSLFAADPDPRSDDRICTRHVPTGWPWARARSRAVLSTRRTGHRTPLLPEIAKPKPAEGRPGEEGIPQGLCSHLGLGRDPALPFTPRSLLSSPELPQPVFPLAHWGCAVG